MKSNKKVLPDEEVKTAISEDKKAPKKGASVKVLGTIIKPLSEDRDKEDHKALADSSLRSPIEALLMHDYAQHELEEHGQESEKDTVCAIKDFLSGVQRENCGFLRDKDHYEKDLGIVSSILTDVLPKGSNIKSLIARALFGKRDYDRHESEGLTPIYDSSYKKSAKEPSSEILSLLK